MSARPLVSVVIPTYNHAHLIGNTLQSVLDQTYREWEAVIVDNYSQDNTDEVIARFPSSRMRVLKIHNHGVIAASRNLGIANSRGEWIAFLDSDDVWYPAKLETLMAEAEDAGGYDVLSNDELRVDTITGEKKVLRYGPYQRDFYRTMLLEGNRLSPSATIVRHEFLVRNRISFDESPAYATVEDFDFWLSLARAGARFKFVREILGEFVVHAINSSAQLTRHLKNGETLLRHHVYDVQDFQPSRDKLWNEIQPRLRYPEARQLAASGERLAALRLALRTFARSPSASGRYLAGKVKRAARMRLG